MIAWLKRGFGWDVEREREIPWRLARKLRLPLSKWLRIGSWFSSSEQCRKCGIEAGDAEFAFRRVGFGRAECVFDFDCARELSEAREDGRLA
jgi:hypothetical protein